MTEETVVCKGPCQRKEWPRFGRSSILRHLSQASKCRSLYTNQDIEELKETSQSRKRKREHDDYDANERRKKHLKTYNKVERREK